MEQNKPFYLYAYLDPRKRGEYVYGNYKFDYEPFYIGKGGGDLFRDKRHLESAYQNSDGNRLKVNKIKKIISLGYKLDDGFIIRFEIGLTEDESMKLESEMIHLIGRKDLNLGPLTNLTDGGEGSSGRHIKWTSEQKSNISKSRKGKVPPNWAKVQADNIGVKKTEETKIKMSRAKMIKSKLNEMKVKEIRLKYATGNTTYSQLSSEYGVNQMTICDIVNLRMYNWVK